jgi:hypothetical protein
VWCSDHFLNLHSLYPPTELLAVYLVAIPQEKAWSGLFRKCLDDLLRSPSRCRMLSKVGVNNAPAIVRQYHHHEEHAKCGGRNVKKSIDTISLTWLSRKVRQVCEGGFLRLGIRRETVRSETSIPSLSSSPWIRRAPHNGLACAICSIKAFTCESTAGRPPVFRRDETRIGIVKNILRKKAEGVDRRLIGVPMCQVQCWTRESRYFCFLTYMACTYN